MPQSQQVEIESKSHLEVNINDITLSQTLIGSGSHGQVVVGILRGKQVSVKSINLDGNDNYFRSEIEMARYV